MKQQTLFLWLLATQISFSQTSADLKNSRFLITSVRTNDTEVFSINPATGDALNVTKEPKSEERYPTWSPDGTHIIYTSNREEKTTYNLYIANANGSNVKKLTNLPTGNVAYWASFTGDGKWIYFNEGVTAMICRVHPDGTGFEKVAEGRDGNISPDGKKIVYTQRGEKGFGVWTMDSDGKNRKQIIPNESEIGGIAPVFSADGKKVAFSMQVGEFAEIFSCNTDGSELKQVTDLKQISSSPAFSPDGQYISFRVTNEAYWRDAKKREKTYEEKAGDKRPVWVIKADGTEGQLIEVLHYQCAMDGSRAEWKPLNKKTKR
jgi:TolB protein